MIDPRLPVLVALLRQGRAVHLTTSVLTLGAWGALGVWGGPVGLWALVGLVFCAQAWFAGRVGFDADLFAQLAAGGTLTDLDRGLVRMGLVSRTPSRDLEDRMAGAHLLWKWQLFWACMQGLLLVIVLIGPWR